MDGIGTAIAALAFWGFLAAVSVAGILDGAKRRQTKHETLRRIVDSGKAIDQDLIDTLLSEGTRNRPQYKSLRIAGIIILSLAPGLAILAAFLGQLDRRAQLPVMGAAGLLACLGIGLLVAAAYDRRSALEDDTSTGMSRKT